MKQRWLAPQLASGAAPVNPPPPDPDDAMLLAVASEATADTIVTGDKPLQQFPWPGPTRIVKPASIL